MRWRRFKARKSRSPPTFDVCMSMPPYTVCCSTPDCGALARYKVAARWSDGQIRELKTYGLACEACVAACFRGACERQAACRLGAGERLDAPGIYVMARGQRDCDLERLSELE